MASNPSQTGRRAAPRLRLSLPGKFLAIGGNFNCIITNLSQTGALIALHEVLNEGDEGYLRCGPIDHFATVTRKLNGLTALEFDNHLSYDLVVRMRDFHDSFAEREQDELVDQVRSWTQGDNHGRI